MLSLALLAAAYVPIETKPFVYPERFTVEPTETVEQAQDRYTKQRKCAKRWALIGILGGTAADIVTTQINQADGFREVNPLYGKHASVGEQLIFHALTGGFNYWQITKASKKYPAQACKTAKISAGVSFIPGIVNAGVRIKF